MENEKNNTKWKLSNAIKKYIITGLVVIIPLWLMYFVMAILFKWMSGFTFHIVKYFLVDKYWIQLVGKISSFCLSFIIIIVLGFIVNRAFGKKTLLSIEKLIEKLPIFGTVHSAAKQFVSFIFGKDSKKSFKQVVFIPYPSKGVYSVAFLTGEQKVNNEKRICVFMPTTPNPTTGFLFLMKEEDIIHTNYSVEQAFQFIISVGVIEMDTTNKSIQLKEEIQDIKDVKKNGL
ncbi:MAG: DUF502 domain-containing protein [Endomicrobium sp.]|jgi:uncharacterized membrane protein|nr:DUF502 domain-containing protein [Endomicrobium sp.]